MRRDRRELQLEDEMIADLRMLTADLRMLTAERADSRRQSHARD
jgi:hypothetical protein